MTETEDVLPILVLAAVGAFAASKILGFLSHDPQSAKVQMIPRRKKYPLRTFSKAELDQAQRQESLVSLPASFFSPKFSVRVRA